ncbi:MAG: hypothetical protein A2Y33_12165 [Spirochaetes bacterium GWF1_51_8]|nr:MAG: hypothetical protein A2Y33_12165 [Spirochaetes bacterium GWF1_51_8]
MSHCSGCGDSQCGDHECSRDMCECGKHEVSTGCEDVSLTFRSFSVEAGRASLKIVSRFPAVKSPKISGNKLLFKLRPGLDLSRVKSLLREKGIETA